MNSRENVSVLKGKAIINYYLSTHVPQPDWHNVTHLRLLCVQMNVCMTRMYLLKHRREYSMGIMAAFEFHNFRT